MSTWATACFQSAYGVASVGNADGCGTGYTLAGEFQRLIDSFALTLNEARDRAINTGNPGFGGGTSYPWQVAETLKNTASYYCSTYPGACPADPSAMTAQYSQILVDTVASYGFDMQGNYSGARDNSPTTDSLYPEGVTQTPLAPNTNVASYSPSSGWAPPLDALPPVVVPSIPAFTSPANVAVTLPGGSPLASGGGSMAVGTASGAGSSQGGSNTQQTTLAGSPAAASIIGSLGPDAAQRKLLIILLAIAVLVILFGRG